MGAVQYSTVQYSTVQYSTVTTDHCRVLVMGEGRILEDGSPRDLLAKPMGFFSALYRQEQRS